MFDKNGNILPEHSGREIDYKDDIFLKMCHKAEIIQKDWKVKTGDQVYYYHKQNLGWRKSFVTTDFVYTDDKFTILDGLASQSGGHYDYTSVAKIHRSDIIWLPRQDQLQKILGKQQEFILGVDCSCQEAWSQIGAINNFKGINWDYLRSMASMEQLWLAFVMKEKYNKTWNGEDWVKGE